VVADDEARVIVSAGFLLRGIFNAEGDGRDGAGQRETQDTTWPTSFPIILSGSAQTGCVRSAGPPDPDLIRQQGGTFTDVCSSAVSYAASLTADRSTPAGPLLRVNAVSSSSSSVRRHLSTSAAGV
jgi:hypothetical protein